MRYSISGLTDLLHRLGFVYKLTTPVPCEADADEQAAFLANRLLPLLEVAATGETVVYFADAAHPPPHALHAGLDRKRRTAAPTHGQRARASQLERSPQCALPHPGARPGKPLPQRPKHASAL